MKFTKYYLLLISIISLTLFSCSDVQNDIAPPMEVSVHGRDALIKASSGFHGKQLVGGKMESCQFCHASDYTGGTAKVSCGTSNCHPGIFVHTENILNHTSPGFHGKFIKQHNWNMEICSQCHGEGYYGGMISPPCNNTICHSQAQGPEACNTCHGDFTNPTSVAPPRAINYAVNTTDPGVGAHQVHLNGIKIGSNIVCNECHLVPGGFKSAGHIDDTPRAEVIFGSFTSAGPSTPAYNFGDYKCSNTYCHGNFKFSKATSEYQFVYTEDFIEGNNYSPQWNKVKDPNSNEGSEAECGTCHGLPPKGHQESELRSCATCHQGVVDIRGNIIDPTKHINGKIDVFGN